MTVATGPPQYREIVDVAEVCVCVCVCVCVRARKINGSPALAQNSFHRWRFLVVEGKLTTRSKLRETAMLLPTNHELLSTDVEKCSYGNLATSLYKDLVNNLKHTCS